MLERLGFRFSVVAEQDQFDGRFPTVKSPNPENAEALKLGVELAREAERGPGDRDGSGLRSHGRGGAHERNGEMKLLTGNQIGSLMAWYRARKLFEQGVLTPGTRRAA